jgi:hypothetical protein
MQSMSKLFANTGTKRQTELTLRHIGTAASSPIGPDALSAVSPRMLSRRVARLHHPSE